jgi:glycerol-3-phosphate responsive antiterminator
MKYINILDSNLEYVYLNINHIVYMKEFINKDENHEIYTLISLIDGTSFETHETVESIYSLILGMPNK